MIFILCASAALLMGTACNEESCTQIVEVELPEHDPRLAIHILMFSQDAEAEVLVSNSRSVLSSEAFSVFPDAAVMLSNVGMPTFEYSGNKGRHYAVLPEGWAVAGRSYTLEVQQEPYPMASSEQTMPDEPKILSAAVEPDGALGPEGERLDEITIEVEDAPGEHYYALQARLETKQVDFFGDTVIQGYPIYMETNDPILSYASIEGISALLCSDDAFNSSTYRFLAYTYEQLPVEEENRWLSVRVISLSRDAFLYLRSLQQYRDSDGNPFAEPVTVHSNISDGYGIFGLGHTATLRVDF